MMKNLPFKLAVFLATLFVATQFCCSSTSQITPAPESSEVPAMPASGSSSTPVNLSTGPFDMQPAVSLACPELPPLPSVDTEGLPPLSVYLLAINTFSESPGTPPDLFDALIVNASEEAFEPANVAVQFYDPNGNPLTSITETCSYYLPPGESCRMSILTEGKMPADYAAYNLYAEGTAAGGTRYEAQLSDRPLKGEEGIQESMPVPLVGVYAYATWNLPAEGYTYGETLGIHFNFSVTEGKPITGNLCGKVIEFRKDASGQLFAIVLAEACQPVAMTQGSETLLDVPFTPSGYSWIEQESGAGTYTPVGILGCLTLDENSINAPMTTLYLPPFQVVEALWVKNGTPVDTYTPGEPLTSRIRVKSLVSDETPRMLSMKIMRYDAGSRLLSWFLPIPLLGGLFCATGACDDLYLQQDFDIQLIEGETTTYDLAVTFPDPGEEYYRILYFDNEPFWGEDDRIK
jgi:hypothetical protein